MYTPSLALNHLTTATKVVANFYIKLTQHDDEMPKRSGKNPVWCDGKSTYGENVMFFRNPPGCMEQYEITSKQTNKRLI